MKKKAWSIGLIAFFCLAVSFVVIKYKNKQQIERNTVYTLLPRNGNNNYAEWLALKNNADSLMARIKAKPTDTKAAIALTNIYIIEARISGNVAYYDNAALHTVEGILAKQPDNAEALMLKSLLELSQHHFAEGLQTATIAVNLVPNNAFGYGLLVDANVELGNYEAAVDAADKMITIRPDLRSYSRISYLREIYGDYPGAISAMKLAVAAGVTAEENTEWCRTQLGRLYENIGEVPQAVYQYNLSLAARPGYVNALSGLGRIALFEKKYDSAIYFNNLAAGLSNDLGIKQSLANAYLHAGQIEKAKAIRTEAINVMIKNAEKSNDESGVGHYSDKELAYAYIHNNDLEKALEHALAEYNRRPKNIDVNETMAWVYYKRNEIAKALPFLEAAMLTNSKKPELLSVAGLIYIKSGNIEKGNKMLKLGLVNNPVMVEDFINESTAVIQKKSN